MRIGVKIPSGLDSMHLAWRRPDAGPSVVTFDTETSAEERIAATSPVVKKAPELLRTLA